MHIASVESGITPAHADEGTYAIGAPIEIANDRYLVIAIVNEVENKDAGSMHREFYLHELMLQDIPPEASVVSSQQAYHDDDVFHAATKTPEAAPARTGDGPIAASADTARSSRGDSSSNENVSRGDVYNLLNKVINVNSLPEITAEAINAVAPDASEDPPPAHA